MMSLLTYCALQRDLNRSSMKERVDLVKKCAMRSLAGVGAARVSLTILFDILIFWFKLVRLWGKYFFGFTLEYFL